eukprot:gnl/MRDRNA2_/MRDRNA2_127011_c0_seq1.p1 gnl/MRDRNA2_/MRDRNA2_127011_c0~~gnl/MRDRNA2_/MRDRNA2_127011_c0_seq1.p1  ORF type:complete len:313 (-),score=37.25 gnl/MRDRNA2_/MRDRNA2_127011_c0_seq1:135-1073(-)
MELIPSASLPQLDKDQVHIDDSHCSVFRPFEELLKIPAYSLVASMMGGHALCQMDLTCCELQKLNVTCAWRAICEVALAGIDFKASFGKYMQPSDRVNDWKFRYIQIKKLLLGKFHPVEESNWHSSDYFFTLRNEQLRGLLDDGLRPNLDFQFLEADEWFTALRSLSFVLIRRADLCIELEVPSNKGEVCMILQNEEKPPIGGALGFNPRLGIVFGASYGYCRNDLRSSGLEPNKAPFEGRMGLSVCGHQISFFRKFASETTYDVRNENPPEFTRCFEHLTFTKGQKLSLLVAFSSSCTERLLRVVRLCSRI